MSLGVRNLLINGPALGWKKTAGKIMQPINSYTRFPEYFFFGESIKRYLASTSKDVRPRVLDVGSPKMFGLGLARSSNVEIEMTDISPLNIHEYRVMWNAVRARAKGTARFSIQDARSLAYPSNQFDVVYSMSVLEHVDGTDGDTQAATELLRVLKPGGLLIFSVPYGNSYAEQKRTGFRGAVEKRRDSVRYFFQRIYDCRALQNRLLLPLRSVRILSQWTVWRARKSVVRTWANLGENANGLLGFLNPWLSFSVNRAASGLRPAIPCSYGEVYSSADVYGDVIVAGEKLP